MTDAINPGQSVSSYEYDHLNRLSTATATNWALQWTYDEFGNRLTQSKVVGSPGTPPEITLAYDEATNRITTSGYTYDYNGNLIAMPGISGVQWVVWSAGVPPAPGVRSISLNEERAAGGRRDACAPYKYDAMGRRMARVTQSGTDFFFYDRSARLLAMYPGNNPNYPQYTRYFAGQKLTHYADRVGSVRYASGVVNHYYPYGELVAGANNTGFKFAETYRDDSGLDYALNRYYASGIGRFLSADPYRASGGPADPASWNRYAYVQNDPVNYLDPAGLDMVVASCSVWSVWGYNGIPEITERVATGYCVTVWPMGLGGEVLPGYEQEPRSGGGGPSITWLDPAVASETRNQAFQMLDDLETDCGDFVTLTLKAAYLLKSGRSLEDLGPETSIYERLSEVSVKNALHNATFWNAGTSPIATIGNETYTTNAIARYKDNSVDFYSGFFGQGDTGRAQITIHEGMHLILGFTDQDFAQVWGVGNADTPTSVASAAWGAILKQHCK